MPNATSKTTHRDARCRLGPLLLLVFVGACSPTGDLVITYLETGAPSAGNEVYVAQGQDTFDRNEYDYLDRTNGVGEVTFIDLEPATYYFGVAGKGPTGLFDLIAGTVDVEGGQVARVTVTGGRAP